MISIVLCSNNKKSILFNTLRNALLKHLNIITINDNYIIGENDKKNNFNLLYKTENLPKFENINGVLIFDNNFKCDNKSCNLNSITPIFQTSNKKAIKILEGLNKPVISCGTSLKDTFSLSSISMECATVSLQRDIVDLSGKIYEPHEFKVKFKGELSPYNILCVSATLLLCGVSSENGYNF